MSVKPFISGSGSKFILVESRAAPVLLRSQTTGAPIAAGAVTAQVELSDDASADSTGSSRRQTRSSSTKEGEQHRRRMWELNSCNADNSRSFVVRQTGRRVIGRVKSQRKSSTSGR